MAFSPQMPTQATAHAAEQREAQMILGLLQGLARGRLRDVQHRGRAGHRAAAHRRAEDFELARPHLSSHRRR